MSNIARYSEGLPEKRVDTTLFVVFRVGDAEYMLAADSVLQMESFAGATAVPGSSAFVAGIVQIRGRVVPVVDLRLCFGAPVGPTVLDNRIVVVQHGERIVGLLVDAAREVVKIAPGQLKPPPAVLTDQARGYVDAVAQLGPRLVMLIDSAKVIGEERP